MKYETDLIYCIGDSHAGFFAGEDKVQPHWPDLPNNTLPMFCSFILGACTAYSLGDSNSESGAGRKIYEVLETISKGSRLLLCFGEVDCRTHLIAQAKKQNRPLIDVVSDCVDRYLVEVRKIKFLGYDPILWGVTPTIPDYEIEDLRDLRKYGKYPMIGTYGERLVVVSMFNSLLYRKAREFKIVNIFDDVVGGNFFLDAVHLSQRAMGFALNQIVRL